MRGIGDREGVQPEGGIEQMVVVLPAGADLQPAPEMTTFLILLKRQGFFDSFVG
ncbi:hypothetical protein [Sinorhizobium fredii]|uniref:hypothetical protein n=1 Tax=Rhizobium fredii TaxID=380 RepID=UPI0004B451D6|nr:hypothetical protein [Sinorhizobium fredii]